VAMVCGVNVLVMGDILVSAPARDLRPG
jgi:hypothetical protein